MKKILMTGVATAAFAISGLGLSIPASAATPAAASATRVPAYCHLWITAKTNVNIHKKPSMATKGNPIVGVLPQGKRHAYCSPKAIWGGAYKYSGTCKTYKYDHYWNHIYTKGGRSLGYVPNTCITWSLHH